MRNTDERNTDQKSIAESTLDNDGRLAWQAVIVTYNMLVQILEPELAKARLSSLAEFNALYVLSTTKDREIEAKEWGTHIPLSQSGLSRLASRLKTRGFVTMSRSTADGRARNIRITAEGLAELGQVWSVYTRVLRDHFSIYLSPEDKRAVAVVLSKVIEPLAQTKEKREGYEFLFRVPLEQLADIHTKS